MKANLILSQNSLTSNTYTDLSEMITQLNDVILDAKEINKDAIFRLENVENTQLYEWLIYRFDDSIADLPNLNSSEWDILAKILYSPEQIENINGLNAEIGFDTKHLTIVPIGNYVYDKATWFDLHRTHFYANLDDMSYFEYSKNKHHNRTDISLENELGVIKRGDKYHLFFPFLDYVQEVFEKTNFHLENKEELAKK